MKLITKINGLSLAAAAYATITLPAMAAAVQLCPKDGDGFNNLCTTNADSLSDVIGKVIQVVLVVAIVLALFFLIWGGIKWVTSGGDKTKVETARNTIIAAIIGLVIALLSFFILRVVLSLFGFSDFNNLQLPTIFGKTG